MALSKSTTHQPSLPPTHCYAPIPHQEEDDQLEGYNIGLPLYHHPTAVHRIRRPTAITLLLLLLLLLLFSSLVYVFWPADPAVKIVRLLLNKIRIHTLPIISIDISLYVTLKVLNVDVYSMDFTSLDVAVKYRGKRLGHVRSDQGHVRALSSSYVDAELDFSGVSVLSDAVFLLDDLARGTVPFDTLSKVSGKLGLMFIRFPFKAMDEMNDLIGMEGLGGQVVQHKLKDSV